MRTASRPRSSAGSGGGRTSGRRSRGRGADAHRREDAGHQGEARPEAVALFLNGLGGTFLKHTIKAYGSPNIAAPSFAQWPRPRDVGFHLTFGEEVGRRTHRHPPRAMPRAHRLAPRREHAHTQVQESPKAMTRARAYRRRSALSIAAARRNTTCRSSREPTCAGVAWIHVLVTEGLYDREYVAQHGFGFEALRGTGARTRRVAYSR